MSEVFTPAFRSRFIKIWNKSNSVKHAARQLGEPRERTAKVASYLRHQGHELKYFKKDTKYDHEKFIALWQKAGSVREVARYFGVTPGQASRRAVNLRNKQVPLKKFPTLRNDVNWGRLRHVANSVKEEFTPHQVAHLLSKELREFVVTHSDATTSLTKAFDAKVHEVRKRLNL